MANGGSTFVGISVSSWLLLAIFNLQPSAVLFAAERGMAVEAVQGKVASVPKYHALVIGINDHQHWQNLREVRQRAEKVAGLLQRRYGFGNVRALYDRDASRERILGKLCRQARELRFTDALLMYFAGHGYYDKLLKKGYWVPTKGRETIRNGPADADWIHDSTLRDNHKAMNARQVLVLGDSCFSGALFWGGQTNLKAKENTWYRRASAAPSRWAISGGDLETVPHQSVFARKLGQLLEHLERDLFSASALASWLKLEVAASSHRQPVFGPLDVTGGGPDSERVFLTTEAGFVLAANTETRPPKPSPDPSSAPKTGTLVVNSPKAGTVSLNGRGAYAITPDRALRWEHIAVGTHRVQVMADGKVWTGKATVLENQTATLTARFGSQVGDTKILDLGGGVTLELVWIPAGEFLMGCDIGNPDEKPVHRVTISQGFWMGKYEVTQSQYEAVMGKNPSTFKGGNKPVHDVSWHDAVAFCRKIGARLPTEAEWEYACRAGTTTIFSSGDTELDLRRVAVYGRHDGKGPSPVGRKKPNRWGLYDMHGNVWEWCADWWHDEYPNGAVTDPVGPPTGESRVMRGGSYRSDRDFCRSACRFTDQPDLTDDNCGFRVVVDGGR